MTSWVDAYVTSVAAVRRMQGRPPRDPADDRADWHNTRTSDPDDRDADVYAEDRDTERAARLDRYLKKRDDA